VLDGTGSLGEHSQEFQIPLPVWPRRHTTPLFSVRAGEVASGWRIFSKGSVDGIGDVVMVGGTTVDLRQDALDPIKRNCVQLLVIRSETGAALLPSSGPSGAHQRELR